MSGQGNPQGNPAICDVGAGYRWKPGKSANPGGRPKRQVISDEMRAAMSAEVPTVLIARLNDAKLLKKRGYRIEQGMSFSECVALTLAIRALGGDVQSAKLLADRCEGHPNKRVSISGEVQHSTSLEISFIRQKLSAMLNPQGNTEALSEGQEIVLEESDQQQPQPEHPAEPRE